MREGVRQHARGGLRGARRHDAVGMLARLRSGRLQPIVLGRLVRQHALQGFASKYLRGQETSQRESRGTAACMYVAIGIRFVPI